MIVDDDQSAKSLPFGFGFIPVFVTIVIDKVSRRRESQRFVRNIDGSRLTAHYLPSSSDVGLDFDCIAITRFHQSGDESSDGTRLIRWRCSSSLTDWASNDAVQAAGRRAEIEPSDQHIWQRERHDHKHRNTSVRPSHVVQHLAELGSHSSSERRRVVLVKVQSQHLGQTFFREQFEQQVTVGADVFAGISPRPAVMNHRPLLILRFDHIEPVHHVEPVH
jgi:hypothetical protein